MARHSNSATFIRYLQNTIPALVEPLEEVAWAVWEEGDDAPEAQEMIKAELYFVGRYFANIDGNVSNDEAAFIHDLDVYWGAESYRELGDNVLAKAMQRSIKSNPEKYQTLFIPKPVWYLQMYDVRNGTDYATQAKSMFFKFANAVTKADGNVSRNEEIALSKYKELLFNFRLEDLEDKTENHFNQSVAGSSSFSNNKNSEPKNLDELLSELSKLVGLDRVKNDVAQLVNFLKVQQMREAKGMAVQPLSRHLVFYGNPGTGKTTVARLLSQIYKSLGILSKGHLIETDRAGLVAGYVGQTALKVREVVSEAVGGVLFIDEAYTLSTGGDNDFGREAIDTLLKMMEDNRDDLIVVVAGYTDKMSAFMQTNPGLRSRFNKYLEFEDYTPEQLVEIFELFCTNGGYKLASLTHDDLIRLFSVLYETRDDTFGNGRLARNLYEMTINNQANRIVMFPNVDDDILSSIEETDIPGMADLQSVR